ncbi:MAG: Holliday junction resolvase RuvX [Candidatus Babeliaceae bacterium]|jgi:putative Holliday junction resolvase
MKKILALDLGDQWVGMALSDVLHILAKPYKTVTVNQLENSLKDIFNEQEIDVIIVGYPKTMKGGHSQQTEKVIATKEKLEALFVDKKWILWDERLSSKRADSLKKKSTKEDAIQSHARAAAFILDTYLTYQRNMRDLD